MGEGVLGSLRADRGVTPAPRRVRDEADVGRPILGKVGVVPGDVTADPSDDEAAPGPPGAAPFDGRSTRDPGAGGVCSAGARRGCGTTIDAPGDLVPDPSPDLHPGELTRLRHADVAAYAALYTAGGPTIGTGQLPLDGALAIWNPHDDDPGFNYIVGFEVAPDPDRAWAMGEAAARAGGARVFGVGVTAERDGWATSSRLAALRLTFAYEEVVWARRLCASEVGAGGRGAGDERVQIRTDAIPPDLFAGVLNRGWELAEDHGRGRLYAAVIGLPDWTHYVAYLEGTAAAAAVLYRHHGVAVCVIAATIPAFRGRGLQTALITRRLDDAVAAGCDLATVETVADNASPRNIGRAGFMVLHRRRIYAKALP